MPTFQVEMLWDCRSCKARRNLGLERHCKNCGHPKDDQDREYFPDNVSIHDALSGDKRRRAEAGPDWKCRYCSSLQNPLNKCCTECGVPQGQDAKKAWDAPVETSTFDPFSGIQMSSTTRKEHVEPIIIDPIDPWKAETPTRPNRQTIRPAATSTSSGDYRDSFTGGYRDAANSIPDFRSPVPWKPLLIVVGGVVALAIILWLIFRTKIEDVHVSTVSWTHSVKIDRYQVWHREGWDADYGAFDIHDLGSRVHHYDHVLVGSHTESYNSRESCGQDCTTPSCYTTAVTCSSNKNGTGTCSGGDRVCPSPSCTTRYCNVPRTRTVDDYQDQPRYRDWYDWNVWDWGYNRTVAHSGATIEESWPTDEELKPVRLNPREQEREEGRFMDHKIVFANVDGETWNLAPKDCSEFERYPVGARHKIKVGLAHGVEVLP